MPDVTCALTLEQTEFASTDNGCIDKFRVRVDLTIPTPFPTSFFAAFCPVAPVIPATPYYDAAVGYNATPPTVFPLDKLANFYPTINGLLVQSSRSGYATINGFSGGDVFEAWFHRDLPNMNTPAFAALYPTNPAGLHIYHYSQAAYTVQFKSTYQEGLGAFSVPILNTVYSNSIALAPVSCSGGGGGGANTNSMSCLDSGTSSQNCLQSGTSGKASVISGTSSKICLT